MRFLAGLVVIGVIIWFLGIPFIGFLIAYGIFMALFEFAFGKNK